MTATAADGTHPTGVHSYFIDTETCVPQIGEESDTIQQRKMKEKSDAGFETETDFDTVLV